MNLRRLTFLRVGHDEEEVTFASALPEARAPVIIVKATGPAIYVE
jgi:hypothetical protein